MSGEGYLFTFLGAVIAGAIWACIPMKCEKHDQRQVWATDSGSLRRADQEEQPAHRQEPTTKERVDMSTENKYTWSPHAVERWAERSDQSENKDSTLSTSRLAGRRVLNKIRKSCKQHAEVTKHGTWTGFHYLTNHGWVFVMKSKTVVTCFKIW